MNKDELITNNLKLINFAIKKMHIFWNTEDEYQEYYDVGLEALIKASNNYELSKGKVSTFFLTYIENALKKLIIYKNTQKRTIPGKINISLDDIIPGTENMLVKDTIIDPNVNIEEELVKKENINNILKYIEKLNKKEKLVIKYRFGLIDGKEYSNQEIEQLLGVSHTSISTYYTRGIKKIKLYMKRLDKIKKQEVNMNTDLGSLNTYLFKELERLNDDKELVDDSNFKREINRAKAIAGVSVVIVNNAKLILDAKKFAYENGIENENEILKISGK